MLQTDSNNQIPPPASLPLYNPGEHVQIEHLSYEVCQFIEGGMGFVYLLESLTATSSFAFPKYLAAKMFKAEIPLKHIVSELNIWLDLHHKNILPLLPISTIDYQTAALSPWRRNGSLHDLVAGSGNLPPAHVKRILSDTVSALEYAWKEKRVLHLDIKPQNLLLSDMPWKDVQVADWGIAKIASRTEIDKANAASPDQVHLASNLAGTIPYMSPERFLPNQNPGIEADMFSLGMLAIQCLTGVLPFLTGKTPLTHQILSGLYLEHLPALIRNLPNDWQGFIQKCLQYESDRRFRSYAAMHRAIKHLREG
jgi:serine/threonine protein kinase